MKKEYIFVLLCAVAMLAFTGCQNTASNSKTSIPNLDYNKNSSVDKGESLSSKDKTESVSIPETEPYAFNYEYDVSRGGMVITDYYKESPKVSIPSELEGEPVVYVDFSSVDKDITTLVLPYGVKGFSLSKDIQKSLSYIFIPTTVKYIYDSDFSQCTSRLTDVVYGDKTYDNKTVAYLIDSLDFDESGLSIADGHLQDVARYMTSVTIPDGVHYIDEYAFEDCSVLTEVIMPDSVAAIMDYAFKGCSSLEEITFPQNTLFIGDGVFKECTSLVKVYIPNSLEYIGQDIFDENSNASIEKYGESTLQIENGVLLSAPTLITNAVVPNSVTKIGEEAFMFCNDLETVVLPEGLIEIGEGAFRYCYNLKTVVIPSTVTVIGKDAFYKCESLTEIVIPENVETIRTDAFYGCKNLENAKYKGQSFDYSHIKELYSLVNGR